MQVVSYRGPGMSGGVSSLIERALKGSSNAEWWHVESHRIHRQRTKQAHVIANISPDISDGHYRYCNEFLWPIMHGLGDNAHYAVTDRNRYRLFNMVMATHLCRDKRLPAFLHDYQMALVPYFMEPVKMSGSMMFWHIPWPAQVPDEYRNQIAEVAQGLLRCSIIGFHTPTYVTNFCDFVRDALPDYRVLSDDRTIVHSSGRYVQLVASPAGIDYAFWCDKSLAVPPYLEPKVPYILSVDRADYTKGIFERIQAIRKVFHDQPHLRGRIQFVFVCPPTRKGIVAFDEYWSRCRSEYLSLVAEVGQADWSPIVWLSDALPPEHIASLYAHARAMLVNPLADGLNLTAKEFVATAASQQSALILSSGAGAWRELKDHVVTIEECRPETVADAIVRALNEPELRHQHNMKALKRIVRGSSLDRWWHGLTRLSHVNRTERAGAWLDAV